MSPVLITIAYLYGLALVDYAKGEKLASISWATIASLLVMFVTAVP